MGSGVSNKGRDLGRPHRYLIKGISQEGLRRGWPSAASFLSRGGTEPSVLQGGPGSSLWSSLRSVSGSGFSGMPAEASEKKVSGSYCLYPRSWSLSSLSSANTSAGLGGLPAGDCSPIPSFGMIAQFQLPPAAQWEVELGVKRLVSKEWEVVSASTSLIIQKSGR